MAKNFMGRAEETETHIQEALRLSPRDIFASRWMVFASYAKMQLGADAEALTWLPKHRGQSKLSVRAFLSRLYSGTPWLAR
jgi:hypothetical protein